MEVVVLIVFEDMLSQMDKFMEKNNDALKTVFPSICSV